MTGPLTADRVVHNTKGCRFESHIALRVDVVTGHTVVVSVCVYFIGRAQ